MSLPIRLSVRAEQEVAMAVEWHGLQRKGRDRHFIVDLERCFKLIGQYPRGAQVVKGTIRQLPLDRFPYVVVYAIGKAEINVLSVFNTWQHPKKRFRKR
jgi:plasmid stabilization system protein ParE